MDDAMTVDVLGLQIDLVAGVSIVLLGRPESSDRVLPIVIGPAEAQAIGFALEGHRPARPPTHDLFVTTVAAMGGRIAGLEITELRGGTFVAELTVVTDHGSELLDARPSDGIALALRVGAPLTVQHDVFESASVAIVGDPGQPIGDDEINRIVTEFRSFLDSTDPGDFAD